MSHLNTLRLRVMSFNIRYDTANDGRNSWQHRRALVVDAICQFDPHLLATQEGLDHQIAYLQANLPDYHCFGVGREDGAMRGEYAAILYRAERFEQLEGGHFWLSESPDVPGSKSWESSQTRIVTWCRLVERSSPTASFTFFNTHFDQRSEAARLASAKLLSHKIRKLSNDGPVILCGDFNSTEAEQPYKSLVSGPTNATGLIDAYRAAHPERLPDELTRHDFCSSRTGSRIDWILHSRHFTTLAATIDRNAFEDRLPSDHYAVTATLLPMAQREAAGQS